MKYAFEAKRQTCVDIEQQLGLQRGDVKSITTHPDGATEIEAIELTVQQLALLNKQFPNHQRDYSVELVAKLQGSKQGGGVGW